MIPTPKYQIGDTVYAAFTEGGKETVQCPDCLGSGTWAVKSPAGYEGETECPRCHGRREITKQFCYQPAVRKLTIGSVRIDTAGRSDPVEYMAKETGIGSGSVYRESLLHSSEESATKAAEVLAIENTERHTERTIDPNRDLRLYDLKYKDAEIKEARNEARDARYDYDALVRRICELDEYPVAGGEFNSEPGCSLTPAQVRAVQNGLVWLDDKATRELLDYRQESDAA